MRIWGKPADWGAWLRILCAVALFCVGFAHKPPVLAAPAIPAEDLSQYILPDGTFPVLCLPGQADDGKSHSHGLGSGCEACRLSASTILPSPPETAGERIRSTLAVLLPPRIEAFYRQLFPPNASPRGPPLSGLIA